MTVGLHLEVHSAQNKTINIIIIDVVSSRSQWIFTMDQDIVKTGAIARLELLHALVVLATIMAAKFLLFYMVIVFG